LSNQLGQVKSSAILSVQCKLICNIIICEIWSEIL
jgi:hypothetical protein